MGGSPGFLRVVLALFPYLYPIDTLVSIWNFLWEYQAILVFPIALVLWIVVRGYDLGKWVRKKAKGKIGESNEGKISETASPQSSGEEMTTETEPALGSRQETIKETGSPQGSGQEMIQETE